IVKAPRSVRQLTTLAWGASLSSSAARSSDAVSHCSSSLAEADGLVPTSQPRHPQARSAGSVPSSDKGTQSAGNTTCQRTEPRPGCSHKRGEINTVWSEPNVRVQKEFEAPSWFGVS